MKRLTQTSSLLLASMLLACDAPTAPPPPLPVFAASASPEGIQACQPVTFETVSGFGQPPFDIEGEMSGDLVGTFGGIFEPASFTMAGKTNRVEGTITFTVTGGALPVPFPLVFTVEFVQLSLEQESSVSPASISEMNGRARGTSGVERANLTYHGYFDAMASLAYHSFKGVICP